ncbi:MAG TPA: metallophosphoesterase, partial [Thermoanaerobaculia bacterium]
MIRFPLLFVAFLAIASASAFAAEVPLVSAGSVWKYLDNGTDQGTAWRSSTFNDGAWPTGAAQLGYGDGDEATRVSFGADPLRKHITTYFRRQFTVTDPAALTSLKVRLVRDDGAVVYLNGTEVWRSNMPGGTITSTTLATGNVSGAAESAWFETSVSTGALVAGTNTVAVEVHQDVSSSSDLSFDFALLGDDGSSLPNLRRGPYLQLGTPTSVVVRWRTDIPSDGRVRYGTSPTSLTSFVNDPTVSTNHSVRLTGLTPFTRYYYSVGTSTAAIGSPDASYTFLTSPEIGDAEPARIWVLGDSGTGDSLARAVRNAYYNRFGTTSTNLWLMLGDNAYDNGTDDEYQLAVFDMYPELLRSTVLWSTIGNHDTANSTVHSPSYPYYDIFTLPTNGEAGGVPSGTERYYSFDYGNIHFICLDSMTTDRSPTGAMMTWLRDDVAATSQKWIVAFWHHPPYSKGSHDSDVETQLIEMRERALPILEEAGVDLVLAGHSHSYERSYLIDGHYGHSSTFVSSMKVDGGSGRPDGDGAYEKPGNATHEGAVYAVAGSGAITSGGALNHPAMFISLNHLGSMVLEVDGNELEATFLRENGTVADSFTIRKGAAVAPVLTATAVSSTTIDLSWTGSASSYRVERCAGAACTNFTEIAQTGSTTFSNSGLTASTLYRYRVFAGGTASNIAEATTFPPAPTGLTATATSSSQINLSWTSSHTSFRVERCAGSGCTNFAQIATTSSPSYSYSGLTASTLYRYRVFAGGSVSNVAE